MTDLIPFLATAAAIDRTQPPQRYQHDQRK